MSILKGLFIYDAINQGLSYIARKLSLEKDIKKDIKSKKVSETKFKFTTEDLPHHYVGKNDGMHLNDHIDSINKSLNLNSFQKSEIEKPEEVFPKPMLLTKNNRKELTSNIVISLEFYIEHPDLLFVGNSRIDGRPIYMYTGIDFSNFNYPYEELY